MQLPFFHGQQELGASKTMNLFLAYMGVGFLQSIFYVFVNKVLYTAMSGKWETVGRITGITSFIFAIVEIVILLMLVTSAKKNIQVWLTVFTILQVILFIIWHILPLF